MRTTIIPASTSHKPRRLLCALMAAASVSVAVCAAAVTSDPPSVAPSLNETMQG